MANNKRPGIDRPYTFNEFTLLIETLAKESNVEYFDRLDYFISSFSERNDTIENSDFMILSQTAYGNSEGIYTDFAIRTMSGERPIFVAKTLGEKDDDYIKMHLLAAKICLLVKKYVREHDDEFNWRGFDVGYERDGNVIPCYWCGKRENAISNAAELRQKGYTPVIRDNAARVNVEF